MTEISMNFECQYCDEYAQGEGRKMGTCNIWIKKVAKAHSCNQNPKVKEFSSIMSNLLGGS